MDRKTFTTAFDRYTSDYDLSDPKIKLKYIHTYKVAENCERIARSLELSQPDIDLAWEIGMLHDIGRFEQLRRFDTFIDAQSIDHAKFGADLLFKEGLIQRFEKDASKYNTIEQAIRYHNRLAVPAGLYKTMQMYCDMIRDADKVDIFRANLDTGVAVVYNVTQEELEQCSISEEAFHTFMEKRTLPREVRHTAVDNLIGLLALAFELVYPESRCIMKEQGCLQQLAQFHSKNSETEEKMEQIRMLLATV